MMNIAVGIVGFFAVITVIWTMTSWFGLIRWMRLASAVLCAATGIGLFATISSLFVIVVLVLAGVITLSQAAWGLAVGLIFFGVTYVVTRNRK
ncbi:hypothetical protein COT86_01520 [Candidatus Collierbacteria bacterium CG10_big_fil_rev_8_21_14_0_10_43_36]|uniref:Uncharacterized protein n=2 Tax=Candidatus Collieribacteriota TaxID=1752725 RepID=A0A2H0DV79_9BACT|nr:MAG: hypothetical protein COW83_00975 [Candidatus Collierbacteria bacterium CG22_combo_CG10-13_8_21_14_all_43_12]PIR99887.1 MAG: hypothetical protein COT86_01520 [Candidatus Collierbacteria bacterium CG10_big_fil_rev_8_21_14_0_10_43_36]